MSDPFALEVHRPIATQGTVELPPLPPYVPRAHDERLAEHVRHAVGGASVMAVLVAGSSAGKTRACWQALEPLRQAGGWRLWHPYDPTRPEAALQQLDRVGPRTVVWLNETQDYLGGGENGERVAAKLRTLLADRGRAPVLVLGTLWPTHHNDLTQRPDSQVRQLLGGTIIEVPEAFTSTDLAALQRAAARDSRLAEAIEHAEDGQVTQYLAGGPELLERLATATPEAKAVIWAAMDARRLGHRTVLPLPLLEQAATAYLTDHQYHQLGEDWLEQALAYLSRPCKGARGPITRIRTARARRVPGPRTASFREHGDFPVYRLADYLDQHGRATRTEQMPPPGFWTAVAALAHPTDQAALGDAAWDRGLTRDATQLWKNATDHGHLPAATHLVTRLHRLHPTDSRPAHYSAARVALNDPQGVAVLLGRLQLVGAEAQVAVLLARNPAAHTLLDFPQGVANLLGRLRLVEAHDQVAVLAERAAAHTLNDPHDVGVLLDALREVEAHDQVAVLAECAAAHTLNDPHDVGVLLDALREVEAHDQVAVLAECAAAHTPLDNLYGVAILLRRLRFEGAEAQVAVLAERAAAHTPLDNPFGVAFLLDALREVEAEAQVAVLAERAAAHTPLDTPRGATVLLGALRKVGAEAQVAVLAERAAHTPLDFPQGVAILLGRLRLVEAHDQVAVLAECAAAHTPLDNLYGVAILLRRLRFEGAEAQVAVLAERAAAHTPLDNPFGVAFLLDALREVEAEAQVAVLAGRAAAHTLLDTPYGVIDLLKALREVGAGAPVAVLAERAAHTPLDTPDGAAGLLRVLREAGAQVAVLAERAAAHTPLDNPFGVAFLLDALREVGAEAQVAVLAERAAAHTPLDTPHGVMDLLEALRKVGAQEQVAVLVERLPAAGLFAQFLKVDDHQKRFRFGRDPESNPAARWCWEDLW